jgi:hypothetical protein
MSEKDGRKPKNPQAGPEPIRVRLPGFVSDEQIGLGDLVKRATYAFGIRPCAGCERRAQAMNRWMVFRR